VAENRINVYASPAVQARLKEMADTRGESVSSFAGRLLEKALEAGAIDDQLGGISVKLDEVVERLSGIGADLPEEVSGERSPSELAGFLAEMREEVRAFGARAMMAEAMADRALYASVASYIHARNTLHRSLGDEAFQALAPQLRGAIVEAYEAQKQKAQAEVFGDQEGLSDA
jgi:hypothetical protein